MIVIAADIFSGGDDGMNLLEYRKKHIRITDVDGEIFTGFADYYTSELDDPEGVASLSIRPDNHEGVVVSFEESEIASIEVITADIP